MSLKDELAQSQKLNAELLLQLAHLDSATDASQPLFKTVVKYVGAAPFTVPGADISPLNRRDTFVVDNLSLNGLRSLVDNPGVLYVSSTSQLFTPEQPECYFEGGGVTRSKRRRALKPPRL
jgi:hypothetical protein